MNLDRKKSLAFSIRLGLEGRAVAPLSKILVAICGGHHAIKPIILLSALHFYGWWKVGAQFSHPASQIKEIRKERFKGSKLVRKHRTRGSP